MGVFNFVIDDPEVPPASDWKQAFTQWLAQALKNSGNLRIAEHSVVSEVLARLEQATTSINLEKNEAQFLLWAFLNLHVSAENNKVYLAYVDRLIKACN